MAEEIPVCFQMLKVRVVPRLVTRRAGNLKRDIVPGLSCRSLELGPVKHSIECFDLVVRQSELYLGIETTLPLEIRAGVNYAPDHTPRIGR